MNWYRISFARTFTPTPRMHQKRIEHGKCCMQSNRLPTKSLVELKNNCNASQVHVKDFAQ